MKKLKENCKDCGGLGCCPDEPCKHEGFCEWCGTPRPPIRMTPQELRRKQIEEILSGCEPEDGPILKDRIDQLLALLSDAERKGAWAVARAMNLPLVHSCWPHCHEHKVSIARQVASSFGPDPEGEGKV